MPQFLSPHFYYAIQRIHQPLSLPKPLQAVHARALGHTENYAYKKDDNEQEQKEPGEPQNAR